MRYFIKIAYKGTAYHGWQKQPNAISVQEVLEKGLSTLLREKVISYGSGRTDTGVHCLCQYVHFDSEEIKDLLVFQQKLNGWLPPDIAVKAVQPMPDKAHARFDAVKRKYEYHITLEKDPFEHERSMRLKCVPDLALMNQAAEFLKTQRDFQSFSKVRTQVNNFLCEVDEAHWVQQGDKLIFYIGANRFLRGMVRALAGTIVEVGKGKISLDEFKAIINAKDRRAAAAAAPPEGLYLVDVLYPDGYFSSFKI